MAMTCCHSAKRALCARLSESQQTFKNLQWHAQSAAGCVLRAPPPPSLRAPARDVDSFICVLFLQFTAKSSHPFCHCVGAESSPVEVAPVPPAVCAAWIPPQQQLACAADLAESDTHGVCVCASMVAALRPVALWGGRADAAGVAPSQTGRKCLRHNHFE
jgi:hypothetical protein